MSKQRYINTKFWSDAWVRKLNPLDRYLFIYFLTNEHTNISGIYELPLSTMAFETGIDVRDLTESMLPRLVPKVIYYKDWIILPNFLKHQNQGSPKVQRGIMQELSAIPTEIRENAIGYGYPIILNLTKLNLTDTKINFGTSASMKNYLEPDSIDKTIDLDGNSLDEGPADQNKEWWRFLAYWKGRVKETHGLDYKVVGGDKAVFHKVFKKIDYNHKTMTHLIEFYLTGNKAEKADIQTIRAALSAHSLMLFEKNRYKL